MTTSTVEPIALCVEYLAVASSKNPSRGDRFMCCVATPGYDVALGLDAGGGVVWRDDARLAFELWVSADQQLMVVRRSGRPEIVVTRSGRSLSLPYEKPVVLLDCDRIEIGGRAMLVHVHGPTEQVQPPEPLREERSTRPIAALATAVAIGASAMGCKTSPEPKAEASAVVPEVDIPPTAPATGDPSGRSEIVEDAADASPPPAASSAPVRPAQTTKKPPIEVRPLPPKPMPPRRDSGVP